MELKLIFNIFTGTFEWIRKDCGGVGDVDGGRSDSIYVSDQYIDGGNADSWS